MHVLIFDLFIAVLSKDHNNMAVVLFIDGHDHNGIEIGQFGTTFNVRQGTNHI